MQSRRGWRAIFAELSHYGFADRGQITGRKVLIDETLHLWIAGDPRPPPDTLLRSLKHGIEGLRRYQHSLDPTDLDAQREGEAADDPADLALHDQFGRVCGPH